MSPRLKNIHALVTKPQFQFEALAPPHPPQRSISWRRRFRRLQTLFSVVPCVTPVWAYERGLLIGVFVKTGRPRRTEKEKEHKCQGQLQTQNNQASFVTLPPPPPPTAASADATFQLRFPVSPSADRLRVWSGPSHTSLHEVPEVTEVPEVPAPRFSSVSMR